MSSTAPSSGPISSPTPQSGFSSSAITAMNDVLQAEFRAYFSYGLVGAHVSETLRPAASVALSDHRQARDWLQTQLVSSGVAPPAPLPAYDTGRIDTPGSAAALAISVELACASRWAYLAGEVSGSAREYACRQAQACATRAVDFGSPPAAFPGLQTAPVGAPSAIPQP